MSLLIDKTIREYNDILSGSEPAPGGGSTAALSGLLGASLSMMVRNISLGKKSYEALKDGIKNKINSDYEGIKAAGNELSAFIDEDTKAFNAVMEAMKLPKETEEERAVRMEAIQKANLHAMEIPLAVANKCLQILKSQLAIARYGNKNAVSDIGVGALLAFAGLEGAVLNVRINLPGIADQSLKADTSAKIEKLIGEAMKCKVEIMDIVNKRIG